MEVQQAQFYNVGGIQEAVGEHQRQQQGVQLENSQVRRSIQQVQSVHGQGFYQEVQDPALDVRYCSLSSSLSLEFGVWWSEPQEVLWCGLW